MTIYKAILSFSILTLISSVNVNAETTYGDIQLLIKQGQLNEALKLTEDQLSRDQADIKLKFIKGLVLTRMDRYQDAEAVFVNLTKNNPELPEPYNNLAVVYAAQGKYEQAEQALQNAINTHPSYATAHENLGDIYAKMASRAYNQALELDTSNQAAREKLSLVNELISAPTAPAKTVVATAETKQVKPMTEPQIVAVPPTEETVSIPEPEIITVKVKPEKEEAISTEAPETQDKETQLERNRAAVEAALNQWANAWSEQDVDLYLASYSKEFIPPKNKRRSVWEKERRQRLLRPKYIKITLSDLKINLHGSEYAEVRFSQRYQSDTYGDKVRKEVLMRKVDEKWLITQERSR